jgi:hypothetical protein
VRPEDIRDYHHDARLVRESPSLGTGDQLRSGGSARPLRYLVWSMMLLFHSIRFAVVRTRDSRERAFEAGRGHCVLIRPLAPAAGG